MNPKLTSRGEVEPARESVSLADVAKRAGVSASTASKALNARTDVNDATRARVEAAARELGYVPNTMAQGLTGAKTGTVGVITSDLEGRFALPILMGVEDALGTDRVLTFLCDARGDEVREQRLVAALLARRVDGIIVVGRQTDARASLGALSVPVVYVYAFSDDPADVSITVDNEQIGRVAGEHVLGAGRTRIAHISGEAHHRAARDRLTGLQHALRAQGLELTAPALFGDWSEAWGRAGTEVLLSSDSLPDAIVCGSDQLARGALDVVRDRGLAVPEDIAVIGIDNWTALAENSRPALTTVDMELEKLGRMAAYRLQRATAGDKRTGTERLPGRVVIRNSTILRR
ncbi:MAG TPA: LacI family DNA-binding transcriptional regulator [Microbacterium sp.]|uniref:LacI family DNA-binding transcriptional regulator n=1 Tax=Microbacterium sp. TaxID=51671 RepID=UPI002CCFA13F|nr:LacI family DNA-binding transcriptional regulator [Microbacterium sp.]HWI30066.1 LacI family DNA-binding transcriptional regulator [Microbacterium sp.]